MDYKSRLRQKQLPETSEIAEYKPKKSSAFYSRIYRERIKEDPKLYRVFRENENLRVKNYLKNMSDEKKEKYREVTRMRVQKFRAKNKSTTVKQVKHAKTRSEKEALRAKWKNEKAKQRAQLSKDQRDRLNQKRRESYAKRRAEKKILDETKKKTKLQKGKHTSHGFQTPGALRKAVSRAKKCLPQSSPKRYTEVLSQLVSKSTPRSRKLLQRQCIVSPNTKRRLSLVESSFGSLATTLKNIKSMKNKEMMDRKKIIAHALNIKKKYASMSKLSGLNPKLLRRASQVDDPKELSYRKKRSDALSPDIVNSVKNFYNRGDISRALPDGRSAQKKPNEIQGRKVMELSLRGAYNKFCEENSNIKLSYSSYSKLRPENIKPITSEKRISCLCEYCVNVDFKLRSLTALCNAQQLTVCSILDRYEASRITLCQKEGPNYSVVCIKRECSQCGVAKVNKFLQPLLRKYKNKPISWFCWETKKVDVGKKSDTKVPVSRMVKEKKTGTVNDLVVQLVADLVPYSKHLFNANWQWKQYDMLTKNIPDNCIVLCMDFAENYSIKSQDEAQSAHWSNPQATIHAVVATHRCTQNLCEEIVTHSMLIISDDLKHCYHAVSHFSTLATKFLQQNNVNMDRIVHFTDGAPTQYKSKFNFADASLAENQYGYKVEKHYFGSRHGKGPCDREIGVVKKQANIDVLGRVVEISDAKDLFDYCKSKLTRPPVDKLDQHVHVKRDFLYVSKGEINRVRPDITSVKPIPKTREFHSFRGMDPYIVTARERSCFCDVCNGVKDGVCSNASLTGEWKTFMMKLGHASSIAKTRDQIVLAEHHEGSSRVVEYRCEDVQKNLNPAIVDVAPRQPENINTGDLQNGDYAGFQCQYVQKHLPLSLSDVISVTSDPDLQDIMFPSLGDGTNSSDIQDVDSVDYQELCLDTTKIQLLSPDIDLDGVHLNTTTEFPSDEAELEPTVTLFEVPDKSTKPPSSDGERLKKRNRVFG